MSPRDIAAELTNQEICSNQLKESKTFRKNKAAIPQGNGQVSIDGQSINAEIISTNAGVRSDQVSFTTQCNGILEADVKPRVALPPTRVIVDRADGCILYRIENTDDSDLILCIGNASINLGTFPRNISLKMQAKRVTDSGGGGSPTDVTTDLTPISAAGLNIVSIYNTIANQGGSHQEIYYSLLPPGEIEDLQITGTIQCTSDIFDAFSNPEGVGIVDGSQGDYKSLIFTDWVTTSVDANIGAISLLTATPPGNSKVSTWGPDDSVSFAVIANIGNTGQNAGAVTATGIITDFTGKFRPSGYLSKPAPGVIYCMIPYLTTSGDWTVRYCTITGTSLSFTEHLWGETVTSNADDFRAPFFAFAGEMTSDNDAGNLFRNKRTTSTGHTQYSLDTTAIESQSSLRFEDPLFDDSFNELKITKFKKPQVAVKILSAVGYDDYLLT